MDYVEHVVSEVLYEWFKQEKIVEHLMSIATRYTRSSILYPARTKEVWLYFSAWIARLEQLEHRLVDFVDHDTEWQGWLDAFEDICQVFRVQIAWCKLYFQRCQEFCLDPTNHTREPFERFHSRASHTWAWLIRPSQRLDQSVFPYL